MKKSIDKSMKHQEALKQFKKNVADVLNSNDTDTILMKWLKSKNYDLQKAEASFREMHAFKLLYCLNTICQTYEKPEVVEKFEYSSFLGYAKDGSVVRYTSMGKGDHLGFIMSMSAYQIGLYSSHVMEKDLERQRMQNKLTGKNNHEITYIFDVEGLSLQDLMHKCVYEMAMDFIHLVQECYPGIWGNIFFINAPPYFDTLFNMFKPILQLSVLEKIKILSRDSIADTLTKYIDEDTLPVFLGGKRVDSKGDPQCKEFIHFGGKIPRSYYLLNRPPLSPADCGVKEVWVRARSAYNYSVVVHKPNTRLRVELQTENGSIHMSIYYRKLGFQMPASDEHLDERDEKCDVRKISPGVRVQTHLSPLNDTNLAPWPGIYIYRFNNSHSWFSSRHLIFRIEATEDKIQD